jgi:uncharacterized membrane protein YphA (DoxX/SURF4 family)
MKKIGTINYSLGMGCIGLLHFFYPGFRPVFIPGWPSWLPGLQPLAYVAGLALIVACAFIIAGFKEWTTSLILGSVLLVLFVFVQVPNQVIHNPGQLAAWTIPLKALAQAGGAFVIAHSVSTGEEETRTDRNRFIKQLARLIPFGRIFFAVPMIVFGIDHFLYTDGVSGLIPGWIPAPVFWTYFTGVALIASGVSIIFEVQVKLLATLLGIMIFIWFVVLHVPKAIEAPDVNNGNAVTSAFQALAFSGIAFVLASKYSKNLAATPDKQLSQRKQ